MTFEKMRVPPAGIVQRPFSKSQADEIDNVFDAMKIGVLVVNVRDDITWVVDGQHRLEVLKRHGFNEWICEVFTNLTDAEAASLFLGRDRRRAISQFDKFLVGVTAGHKREMAIRQLIDAEGLKVSRAHEERCVAAVHALVSVYDRFGVNVLGQTLRTLRDAFDGDEAAFDGLLIEGMAQVYNRYNGHMTEEEMTSRLSDMRGGSRGLMQAAERTRLNTSAPRRNCIAAAIVEMYNKRAASARDRLSSWWKPMPETAKKKNTRIARRSRPRPTAPSGQEASL
jgi:hypothetical protein